MAHRHWPSFPMPCVVKHVTRWFPDLVLSQWGWSILENFHFDKILKVSCSSSICHFSFSLRHCRKRSFLTRITLLHRQLNVIGARCHRILQNTAPIPISKWWQSFVSLFWHPFLPPAWFRMNICVILLWIYLLVGTVWKAEYSTEFDFKFPIEYLLSRAFL